MLIDLHNHTGWGSGCSHLEPGVLIEQARHWGLDGVAITEHNQVWDPKKIAMLRRRHEFTIIPGVEVDEVDGILVVAHPFRDTKVNKLNGSLAAGQPALERFRVVDAIEAYNGIGGGGHSAREMADLLEKPTTGGSDTHRFMDVASCFTVFEDKIEDERDLIEAIKAGRCHGGDWASESLPNKRLEELTSGRATPVSGRPASVRGT